MSLKLYAIKINKKWVFVKNLFPQVDFIKTTFK